MHSGSLGIRGINKQKAHKKAVTVNLSSYTVNLSFWNDQFVVMKRSICRHITVNLSLYVLWKPWYSWPPASLKNIKKEKTKKRVGRSICRHMKLKLHTLNSEIYLDFLGYRQISLYYNLLESSKTGLVCHASHNQPPAIFHQSLFPAAQHWPNTGQDCA
jgi:hypothetical protein